MAALRDVSLQLNPGELSVLLGRSGSGKSTLLHVCGGLTRPTKGTVRIEGSDLSTLDDAHLTELRRRRVGYVFQAFHLMPALTAWENVALPGVLDGRPSVSMRARAHELLGGMGLADRADRRPGQLSGGEQQRVVLARALVLSPPLLLADEPTGNLDSESGDAVFEAISVAARGGCAVLVATHDEARANGVDHVLRIRDGRLEGAR